ncbi:bacterial Ig-like domain-containing protein [Enterococcus villorum]|uniref:bacterial Ig-like domain-containing protein n=1 Tax=Enterococcus villorum TaxID=112904 RepID=UPI0009C042D6|nr:bacterial Ig-like domain-containing protein [Enterococcus villorum]OQO72676.1 hypothetical protein BH744_11210 [Enterococcus villorum]
MFNKKVVKKLVIALVCTTGLNSFIFTSEGVFANQPLEKQVLANKKLNVIWPNDYEYIGRNDEIHWPKWSELEEIDYDTHDITGAQVQHNNIIYRSEWHKKKQYDVEPGTSSVENTGWRPVGKVERHRLSTGEIVFKSVILNPGIPYNPLKSISKPIKANYEEYGNVDAGQGNREWPENVFVPFVDTSLWYNSEEEYGLYPIFKELKNSSVKFINIGSIVASPHTPWMGSFAGKNDIDGFGVDGTIVENFSKQMKAFREHGGDIMFTFGGNGQNHLYEEKDSETVDRYVEAIQGYNLTHLNFAFEEKDLNNLDAWKFNNDALVSVKNRMREEMPKIWVTMPATKEGISEKAQSLIKDLLNKGVDIQGVNIIAKDYGIGQIDDYYKIIVESSEALKTQIKDIYKSIGDSLTDVDAYQKIGLTPHIGKSEATGEIFNQKDAYQLREYVENKNIGLLSMSSLNRDNNLDEEGKNTGITQEQAYEFSHIFSGFNDYKNNQTSIQTKDITLFVGESWDNKLGFVSATDEEGKSVTWGSPNITVDGTVDTNKAGTYDLTYTYRGKTKEVKSTMTVTVIENNKQIISIGGQGISSNKDTHKSGFARLSLEVENKQLSLVKNSDYQFHWYSWPQNKYASVKVTDEQGKILFDQTWGPKEKVEGNGYQKFGIFKQFNLQEGSKVEIFHAEGNYHRFSTSDNDELKTKLGKTGNTYIYTMQEKGLVLTEVK